MSDHDSPKRADEKAFARDALLHKQPTETPPGTDPHFKDGDVVGLQMMNGRWSAALMKGGRGPPAALGDGDTPEKALAHLRELANLSGWMDHFRKSP